MILHENVHKSFILFLKILFIALIAFLLVSYLTSASEVIGSFGSTLPFDPTNTDVDTVTTNILRITWDKGINSDKTYIEYNSTSLVNWTVGDSTMLYNDTGTETILSGLEPAERVYFKLWSYNETYGTYSLGLGAVVSGQTLSTNITLIPYPNDNEQISYDSMLFGVQVSHINGETMNVTWYKMINGSWVAMGDSLVGVNNGTYYKDASGWGYDLYGYEYSYRIVVESSGGDIIDSTIVFSILPDIGTAAFLSENFIFILMMVIWVILLFIGEWKDDPMYSAICGGLGVGIIPASFLAFGVNPYTIGFGLAWSILNFYILLVSSLYLYQLIMGRKLRK